MVVSAPLARADTDDASDRESLQAVASVDGAATGSIDDLRVQDGAVMFDDLEVKIAGVDGEPRTVDNAVLLEGDRVVDHVVRKMDDGAQFLSIINEKASKEIRYEFPGRYLEIVDTGHVVVRDESPTGEPVAIIDPAWARDSSGASQDTSFTVEGQTLVQRVEVSSTAELPVVADPRARYAWYGATIDFTKNETFNLSAGGAGCATLVAGMPLPKKAKALSSAICAAAGVYAGSAYKAGKCVSIKVTYLVFPVAYAPWIQECYA